MYDKYYKVIQSKKLIILFALNKVVNKNNTVEC